MSIQHDTFQFDLLKWYDENKRVLPWRENPTPYRVWISEIMLQQTRVEAVQPYFERFIDAMPTIKDVAIADLDYLNKLWQGLGYYQRIRNIQKAAQQVIRIHNGIFPQSYDEVIALPGIGQYTVGAILSIAYNQQFTAVDGNVYRVFARLLAIPKPIKDKDIKRQIKEEVASFLPVERIGDFNQALMELGAKICLPNGSPKCSDCPVKDHCKGYRLGIQDSIPVKGKKKERKKEQLTVLVLKYGDLYAIRKRPDTGLLSGLYEFYNEPMKKTIEELDIFPHLSVKSEYRLGSYTHIFTHKEWYMRGYLVVLNERPNLDFEWVTVEDMNQFYSIPTAFQYFKQHIKR